MKKTFLALVLCTLFIPSFVSAQTASSTPPSPEIAALILQLEAKIKELQQQLVVLQASVTQGEASSADVAALSALTQTLTRGMSNDQVADLQRYLAKNPDIYPEGIISGYFGALTEQAVKRLQKAKGLEPVGIVGPKTRAIINTEIVSSSGGSSDGGSVSGLVPTLSQSSSAITIVTPQAGTTTPAPSTTTTTTYSANTTTTTSASTTPTTPPAPVVGDHVGPRISALSITPTSITANGQVTFTVTADDVSGVGNVIYDITYPDGLHVLRPNCNFNLASSGTCSFTQTITDANSPALLGSYTIGTIRASDGAGNTATHYPNGTVVNGPNVTHSLTIPVIVVSTTVTQSPLQSDTTAPTVELTAPTTTSTLSGSVTLSASASDNVGVAGVQFLLDGNNVGSEDTSSPFSVSWDTTGSANGTHTLSARARDAVGNQTTSSSISVTTSNSVTTSDTVPPTVSLTAPENSATVNGTVTISATASDNVGVTIVYFRADGGALGEMSTAPYSFSWNTTGVSNGAHVLSAIAHDAAGNITTSSSVSVTVSNVSTDITPPTVSITVPPVSGYLYVGDKTVSATASANDNVAVAGVRFYVDGTLIGDEDTSSPYSASLSTVNYSSGSHTLVATAHDAVGNAATSSVIFYTYKTRPIVTSTALPTSILTTGTQVIGKITIAADSQGGGAVAWRKIVLNHSTSANVNLSNFQMFDSSAYYNNAGSVVPNAQPLAGVTISSTGSTITFTSSADQEIAGSKTYVITATVGGTLQSGDTVTTYVPAGVSQFSAPTTLSSVSSSASLVWSDESAIPHSDTSSDWNNEFFLTTGPNVYIPTSAQTMTF